MAYIYATIRDKRQETRDHELLSLVSCLVSQIIGTFRPPGTSIARLAV
jgi:hypothetical protein